MKELPGSNFSFDANLNYEFDPSLVTSPADGRSGRFVCETLCVSSTGPSTVNISFPAE